MRAKNITERKKRIAAFAGIYAASIILLLVIFSALGMHVTSDQSVGPRAAASTTAEADLTFLQADSLLHGKLQELQVADFNYRMANDTGSLATLNKAMSSITEKETAVKKMADSIRLISSVYGETERARYSTMLNTFDQMLSDRQALKNTVTATVKTGEQGEEKNAAGLLQYKNELLFKNNDIERLQSEIKLLRERSNIPSKSSGADEAVNGETALLKTAFNDQQKELDALKEKYTRLKADNTTINNQLLEARKNNALSKTENTTAATDNKVNSMQQQLEALGADLYFAKIDCNLARTDAQQMISNARQRKELLSESLVMLNSLAKSPDTEIQKKAKAKIIQLNKIAVTLHD